MLILSNCLNYSAGSVKFIEPMNLRILGELDIAKRWVWESEEH
jgi:hypothetical protein